MKTVTLVRQMPLEWLGGFIWICLFAIHLPYSLFQLTHVELLLLAAPLSIVLLGWKLMHVPFHLRLWGLGSAISLSVAYLLPASFLAMFFAIPWLAIAGFITWQAWLNRSNDQVLPLHFLANLFLTVGASWAVIDRLGVQPLGFDPSIVLLTAAHFHYAGFCLVLITTFFSAHFSPIWSKFTQWSVVAGVPLVAIGISFTQFEFLLWIEPLAVSVMTAAGMLVGSLNIKLGWKNRYKIYGALWLVGGIALLLGMALALLYGWREYVFIAPLSIPFMYALHGTLNAMGFALPTLLGWFLYRRASRFWENALL